MKNRLFAYAKTKTQISFAVTAKLISAFVFVARIVQPLFYLNPKFQASSYLLWLYSPVCVGPGRKPRRPVFSERGSNIIKYAHFLFFCDMFSSNASSSELDFCSVSMLRKDSIFTSVDSRRTSCQLLVKQWTLSSARLSHVGMLRTSGTMLMVGTTSPHWWLGILTQAQTNK